MEKRLNKLAESLRISLFSIQIEFTSNAKFHFFHGAAVYGATMQALGLPDSYPRNLIPHIVESGTLSYLPGEPYNLAFTIIGKSPDASELVKSFKRLGSDGQPSDRVPLSGNFKLVKALDCLSQEPCEKGKLTLFGATDIPKNTLNIIEAAPITLRFYSPLRIRRDADQKKRGNAYFDPSHFDINRFLYLFIRRIEDIVNIEKSDSRQIRDFVAALNIQLKSKRLAWIDVPYPNKTLGGVIGDVEFSAAKIPLPLAKLLFLGQYIHAGKNASFGFGEYLLMPGERPFFPKRAVSLVEKMLSPINIRDAAKHIGPPPSLHDIDCAAFSNQNQEEDEEKTSSGYYQASAYTETEAYNDYETFDFLSDHILAVKENKYRPSPLEGVLVCSGKNSYRPLAIPSITDRILQRAASQILSPSADAILSESAYAYRSGLSRFNAADAIERAFRQGYEYALEADIVGFFDNVSFDALNSRVSALWRDDPICRLVMNWVKAPVVFDGTKIEREIGLPQGAPVSPMLSNLFLVEFDQTLQKKGLKLVRYGDDFVVLAKSQAEAEQALQISAEALEEQGLELNQEKTRITSFDQGFRFLGFLFCRSLVLESPSNRPSEISIVNTFSGLRKLLEKASKPLPGWAKLVDPEARSQEAKSFWLKAPTLELPEPETDAVPLYLHGWSAQLSVWKDDLVIRDFAAGTSVRIPWRNVSDLVLAGPPSLSGRFLHRCARDGKSIILCRLDGELVGVLTPSSKYTRYENLEIQLRRSFQENFCASFARTICRAKLINQKTVLKRQVKYDLEKQINYINAQIKKLDHVTGQNMIDGFRAVEGQAAHIFFQAFQKCIPAGFPPMGKRGQGATDPINAMLNFSYTMIYRQVRLALETAGLHPGIGLMHKGRRSFSALAADLEEEFRHLAELFVLRMVHLKIIQPKDFFYNKADPRVWLSFSARRRLIIEFERLMTREIKIKDLDKSVSYRTIIRRQAVALKRFIHGQLPTYQPFIIR